MIFDLSNGFNPSVFNELLIYCTENGVNDIFIDAEKPIAIKKDGDVKSLSTIPVTFDELVLVLKSIYGASALEEMPKRGLDFSHEVPNRVDGSYRFRVNCTKVKGPLQEDRGVAVVIRTIAGIPPKAETLGVPQVFLDSMKLKAGMVLICGPTGSGKSTLFAAMLRWVRENIPRHIITYESPIEYDVQGVVGALGHCNQCEIPTMIRSYEEAGRNTLRRSPDIIVYGESRDMETTKHVIEIARQGHLVGTTLHTDSAYLAPSRMADYWSGAERKSQLAKIIEASKLIVSQKLVKGRNGGRVALQEWITLTKDQSEYLITKLRSQEDVTSELRQIMYEFGQPIAVDAKNKYLAGKIHFREYMLCLLESAMESELKAVSEVIQTAYTNGVIDQEELTHTLKQVADHERLF